MPCKEGDFALYRPASSDPETPGGGSGSELEALVETMRRSLKLRSGGKERPRGPQPYPLPCCCARASQLRPDGETASRGEPEQRRAACSRAAGRSPRAEVELEPQRALQELLRRGGLIQEAVKRLRARRLRGCGGRWGEAQVEPC